MRIDDPDGRGLDPEQYWMVYRESIVEEVYFDNEQEARAFADSKPYRGFKVEAPVSKASGTHAAAGNAELNSK